MRYYPLFLDVRGRPVLVAGAGPVAVRKVQGLLAAGAVVTVIAPDGVDAMASLPVRWLRRKVRASDARGCALVFAATNDRAVNRNLAAAASAAGIPVNVADSAAECTFLVPARVQCGDLQVAVSTGGRSPRLAASLRRKIEALLREHAPACEHEKE